MQKKQISLSVDEIALAFSLINMAGVGKSFLQNAYGHVSSASMEDKLTAASHSLLARGMAKISDQGAAVLDDEVEACLYPLIKFQNMVQVTLGSPDGAGPDIVNIYLGRNGVFTALRVRMGVIYELTHAATNDIAVVAGDHLHLDEQLIPFVDTGAAIGSIKMASIASLIGQREKDPVLLLRQAGIYEAAAQALGHDLRSPRGRGSVVVTGVTSENYLKKNMDEAGAGFLLLWGRYAWMFRFENADDQTVAQIIPCSTPLFLSGTSNLVSGG